MTIHRGCSALKWNEHVLETYIKADQVLLAPSFLCIHHVFLYACACVRVCVWECNSVALHPCFWTSFLTLNVLVPTLASLPILAYILELFQNPFRNRLFVCELTSKDRISHTCSFLCILTFKTVKKMIPRAIKESKKWSLKKRGDEKHWKAWLLYSSFQKYFDFAVK